MPEQCFRGLVMRTRQRGRRIWNRAASGHQAGRDGHRRELYPGHHAVLFRGLLLLYLYYFTTTAVRGKVQQSTRYHEHTKIPWYVARPIAVRMEEEFEEEGASPRPEEGGGASEEEEDEVEGEDNVSVFEIDGDVRG